MKTKEVASLAIKIDIDKLGDPSSPYSGKVVLCLDYNDQFVLRALEEIEGNWWLSIKDIKRGYVNLEGDFINEVQE